MSEERFDLLIADILLPDGSGLDLVRWVRTRLRIPAVALSGLGTFQDIERSIAAGFDVHLVKPVTASDVERTIKDLLGTRSAA